MKKKFIFLFFSILIFNCAHTLSENELNTYLKNFVCIPQNVSEITGTYQKSSGFDGEILELKKDGTCFYNNWSEISLIDNPVAGYSGKFYNSNDTLVFVFSGIVYKDSTNNFLIDNQNNIKNQLLYVRLSSMFSPSFLIRKNNNIFILRDW